MASEINFSVSLQVVKSGLTTALTASKTIDQSGVGTTAETQAIGTSTEALDIGDISDIGYVMVKNLDETNFVRLGLATPVTAGDAMITLLPGEFAFFPTRLETIYAIADTGACNVQFIAASR